VFFALKYSCYSVCYKRRFTAGLLRKFMMFRTALFFLIIFVCMSATVSFAVAIKDLTDITNKHNMSNQSSNTVKAQPLANDGTDQICIFCHTPHSATPDSPLWSRPEPAGSFQIYGNPLVIGGGLDAGDLAGQRARSQYNTAALYPNGASRMCLSCHDGVTAIGLLRDTTTINMLGATKLAGYNSAISLSTSHPISFVYDVNVLADLLGYYPAGSYFLPLTTDAIDTPLDGQSRMQCTTCHDPHDDTSDAIGLPFWRQTSGTTHYDDVCDACHSAALFSPAGPDGDHTVLPLP
jgi:hypothetical protein